MFLQLCFGIGVRVNLSVKHRKLQTQKQAWMDVIQDETADNEESKLDPVPAVLWSRLWRNRACRSGEVPPKIRTRV